MFLKEHFNNNIPDNITDEAEAITYLLDNGYTVEKLINRIKRRKNIEHINDYRMREMNLDDSFYKEERVLFTGEDKLIVIIDRDVDEEKEKRIINFLKEKFDIDKIDEYQFVFQFEFDYIVSKILADGFVKEFRTDDILVKENDFGNRKLMPNDFANIFEEIIERGLRYGTSDIHIEPKVDYLDVRYRVFGVLGNLYRINIGLDESDRILNLFLQESELDINNVREGQNGRLNDRDFEGRSYSFRLSSQPILLGDERSMKIVIRVLERGGDVTSLDKLGFSLDNKNKLESVTREPDGIILITGPTGSGKSTSLHSMLSLLDADTMNIHTIEDPVERTLPGINQTCVQTTGIGFDSHLKNLLRQDPDVIMVGEIRDGITADLSVQGAMTGHLLLSTLHTNNSYDAVQRLKNLNVDRDNLAVSLRAVVGQRLVKTICPACSVRESITEEELEYLKRLKERYDVHDQLNLDDFKEVYHRRGCFQCRQTGYVGRTIISEIMVVDDELRERIYKGEHITAKSLDYQGFIPKEVDAVEKSKGKDAVTDIDEIRRVCGRLGT